MFNVFSLVKNMFAYIFATLLLLQYVVMLFTRLYKWCLRILSSYIVAASVEDAETRK